MEKYSASFENWGHPSEEPCWMCKKKPARSEPRFGYVACEDHYHIAPLIFNHAPFRPKNK